MGTGVYYRPLRATRHPGEGGKTLCWEGGQTDDPRS